VSLLDGRSVTASGNLCCYNSAATDAGIDQIRGEFSLDQHAARGWTMRVVSRAMRSAFDVHACAG